MKAQLEKNIIASPSCWFRVLAIRVELLFPMRQFCDGQFCDATFGTRQFSADDPVRQTTACVVGRESMCWKSLLGDSSHVHSRTSLATNGLRYSVGNEDSLSFKENSMENIVSPRQGDRTEPEWER